MMVDLTEKELAAVLELVVIEHRTKNDKSTEAEVLELKLTEALLKESGQWPIQITEAKKQEAMRLLEEHRKQEENQ